MVEAVNIAKKVSPQEKEETNAVIGIVEYRDPLAKITINSSSAQDINYNVKLSNQEVRDKVIQELITYCRSIGKKIEYSKSLGISENIFFRIIDK